MWRRRWVPPLVAAVLAVQSHSYGSMGRVYRNQQDAIQRLRRMLVCQAQTRKTVARDRDGDGVGEFVEIDSPEPLWAHDLENVAPKDRREGLSGGYVFRVFVPSGPDDAEQYLCAVAWPQEYRRTGNHTFLITQDGRLFETKNPSYSGVGRGPTLADIYQDAPFVTPIRADMWRQCGPPWQPEIDAIPQTSTDFLVTLDCRGKDDWKDLGWLLVDTAIVLLVFPAFLAVIAFIVVRRIRSRREQGRSEGNR